MTRPFVWVATAILFIGATDCVRQADTDNAENATAIDASKLYARGRVVAAEEGATSASIWTREGPGVPDRSRPGLEGAWVRLGTEDGAINLEEATDENGDFEIGPFVSPSPDAEIFVVVTDPGYKGASLSNVDFSTGTATLVFELPRASCERRTAGD